MSGNCSCFVNHMRATPPWTCPCACHTRQQSGTARLLLSCSCGYDELVRVAEDPRCDVHGVAESKPILGVVVELRQTINKLHNEIASLSLLLGKLEGLVIGADEDETAANIFATAHGSGMSTTAVYALAKELHARRQ